ncbi:MAG: aminotransferase class V-fold PLP-dependent enzyme [Deltaproteobacteria bacterium]|nr:aminotransferase class V-fold PLP-dependent enzyme [Deltaproteobacteria bacterium]
MGDATATAKVPAARKWILLNPGPVVTTDRVKAAMSGPDLCHREVEFSDLLARIRAKLLKALACEATHTVAVLTGSGTAAVEAAVSSSVSAGRKIGVLVNGVYGERICEMAKAHGIETVELRQPWGEPIDLARAEAIVADAGVEVVAMVHHETTTGLLNPVRAVGSMCARHGKKFLVDAISSMAGEDLDLERDHVDFVVGTANKCFHGLPGLSFAWIRKSEMARISAAPKRSLYFHLPTYITQQDKGDVPFTPAVQVAYALEAALDELLTEGVTNRIARYKARATEVRRACDELGLGQMLAPEHRSNTITTIYLPEGVTYAALHDHLKAAGFIIYAGQGALSKTIFRIANMGELTSGDMARLVGELTKALAAIRGGKGK